MNVFVLCTGRCGPTTFIEACKHMHNYTAGHETRCKYLGADRVAYPANHIEADNRLSWFLGRLDQAYGNDAFYVHLTRDPEAVAQSFTRRTEGGIALAYRRDILLNVTATSPTLESSRDYVTTVTENIRFFLRDKQHWMPFRLENAAEDFPLFCERIGAEGDLNAGKNEWSVSHNNSDIRHPPPTHPQLSLPYRMARQAARSLGLARDSR